MDGRYFLVDRYNKINLMRKATERKAWTEEEDNILKDLYERRNITKWSEISRIMENQYHIQGRNGKQCRERYHNHLDESIKHEKWSEAEERELIKHQNEIGNKWAQISRFVVGRSENDIKNQFYSILRRGLRQINAVIRKQLKRYKQLQIEILYRIVEACENNAKRKVKAKVMAQNAELKTSIIHFAFTQDQNQESDVNTIKKFIEKLKNLNKGKKSKEKGLENEEKESDEIESAQLRDNCPVAEIKLEDAEQKFRKNSFFNFTLEQPEVDLQPKNEPKPANAHPYKLRKRSSFCSNHSFDMGSPRWNQSLDHIFKSFQMPQTDNFSPKAQFYATSPYFDQYKSNFSHLNHPFLH